MPPILPDLPGVTHRHVTVNGVRLHVAEAGEGPPILLQHGWPQNWWVWRKLIGPLSEDHRVVCPDLRGFGWSEAPRGRYDKETLAGDLLGIMDELGIALPGSGEQLRLVGHDWGGFIGFLACLRAPERFQSYLALSITHPWFTLGGGMPDPRALARLWYQFVISSPLGPALLSREGAMRRVFATAGEGVFDEETIELYAGSLAQPASARASQSLYRTFLVSEVPAILRGRYAGQRLTVPTRLVIGKRDPVLTRDSVRGWEPHADDMSVRWVPDSNHWLPEQRHLLVLDELAQMAPAASAPAL
jgi:pimeloyl-ACP methyl ester carboxylesterase